jgi:uncharacterized membrane protein
MKKKYLLLCVLIVLATLAATLFVYAELPAQIPVHWNAHGQIDRYGPRATIFVQTAVMLLFILLWMALPRISPQHFAVDGFEDTYWYTCLVVVGLLGYIQLVLVWGAWTHTMAMNRPMLGGLAVFVTLLGNVIGKVRRNFWLGVRTPWTLASERVWYSTHRLAAKSLVVAGLSALLTAILGLPALLTLCLIGAGFVVPVVWSLLYYKRLERSGRLEA